jgi:hypothetical protein
MHRQEPTFLQSVGGQEEPMTNENFQGSESPASQSSKQEKKVRDAASEAFSKASDMARDAGEKAKRAAADTASSLSDSAMGILNEQLGAGVDRAGKFASSMRLAAVDLEQQQSPLLADLVRGLAHNVDSYADNLEGQTVEQLVQNASDFTRRQPALVFGLAAIAGFFAFRTFKNARTVSSPPIQPSAHHPSDRSHG